MRLSVKRFAWILAPLIMLTGVARPADPPSTRGSGETRPPGYVKYTFAPKSVPMAAAGAAINQANDTPHEWGQGVAGFGKRFASAFGKHVVHKTIQYPIARLRHEEFGYHPSGKTGFAPRLKYALVSTVITHKTDTGNRTVAVGELSGAFGSGLISRLWQPASLHTVASGLTSGGITLGIDGGMNVVKEFWPEIRHPRRTREAGNAQARKPAEQPSGIEESD